MVLAISFVLGPAYGVERPLAARDLLLDIAVAGGRWVAVGAYGAVVYSDDGVHWQVADSPTDALLTAVALGPGGTAWAVGHDGVVLLSTDGGAHWSRVHDDPQADGPLLDVWMAGSEREGIAVGAYSQLLVTVDGGRSWRPASLAVVDDGGGGSTGSDDDLPLDVHLNAIGEGPDGALYMAAEAGRLFRSDDRGASWVALPSPYVGSFFGVLPLESGVVLAFGLRGHLYRSTDRGAHWTRIETGTQEMLTDGLRLRDGRLLIVGLGGVVLVSEDGGRSFDLSTRADRAGLSAVVQHPDGRVLAVGEHGIVTLEPPAARAGSR